MRRIDVPPPDPMHPDRPKSHAHDRVQGHLFEKPSPLLTIGEVERQFCDRLGIHRVTFYSSHRPWLPFVFTRVRPVKGQPGKYKKGSPRLRQDVATELLNLAAAGFWPDYVARDLLESHPHLYPREVRQAA